MRTLVCTTSPATKIPPHCEKDVYDKVLRFRLGRLRIAEFTIEFRRSRSTYKINSK